MKPAILQHKFNMKGSLSCIMVNPSMLEYVLEALDGLAEETQLPLETYTILPNLYVSEKVVYIVDDCGDLTIIGFSTDARDFFGTGEE